MSCPVIQVLYFYSASPTCFLLLPSGELALTNFDTQRLEEITKRGIRISSNQVTLPPYMFVPYFIRLLISLSSSDESEVFNVAVSVGSVLCD